MIDRFPYIKTLLSIQLNRVVGKKNVKEIVDIGAYQGDAALFFAETYPTARVHAIEPFSNNQKVLEEKAALASNFIYHRLAIVGGQQNSSLLYFQRGEKSSQSNSMIRESLLDENIDIGTESVECSTLKMFCERNKIRSIDLLMMNCEGSEFEIFDTSKEIIRKAKVIDLLMHGKDLAFLTRDKAQKKVDINTYLTGEGFELLYGEPVRKISDVPYGHLRQVWVSTT